jgi:hypothetical protein
VSGFAKFSRILQEKKLVGKKGRAGAATVAILVVLGALGTVALFSVGVVQGTSPACSVTVHTENVGDNAIQDAINAYPGGVVCVGKGTFPEHLQISTSGTTLSGAGAANTIIEPTTEHANTYNYDSATSVGDWSSLQPMMADILVANTSDVAIEDLTVNGGVVADELTNCSLAYTGVDFQSSSGMLTDANVENIVLADPSCQLGYGVLAYNGGAYTGVPLPLAVTISHSTVTNTQINGISCFDEGMTCTIASNKVTGLGPDPYNTQNGIVVSDAFATVDHNTVSDFNYTGSTYDWWTGYQSGGIVLSDPETGNTVSSNTLTLDETGITFTDDGAYDSGSGSVTIVRNLADSSSAYGIVAYCVGAPGDTINISSNTVNNEKALSPSIWGAPGILVDGGTYTLNGNHILGSSTAAGSSNGASQSDPPGTIATGGIQATSESSADPTSVDVSGTHYTDDSNELVTLGESGGSVNVT